MGRRAILKVRMQIPEDEDPSSDPNVRAEDASDVYGVMTRRELHTLSWLTERRCSVSPRLLCIVESTQDDPGNDMPVPGGWVVFILMERVPGVPLTDFRTYDLAKREKVRRAFHKSLTEIYSHHVFLFDNNLSNVLYDEKQNKCYFVDFEDVWVDPKKPAPKFFSDLEYEIWWLDDKKLGLVDSADSADQDDNAVETSEIEKGGTMLTL